MFVKPSVYIETTIISYLTARSGRDLIIAAHQQITNEWWADVRPQVDCYVSPFVIDEASRGDVVFAQKRLDEIEGFVVLEVNKQIEDLAKKYFAALQIPEKAKIDAFHLVVAAWHKMDYVLSWNCKHIANAETLGLIESVCREVGYHPPQICTPYGLLGDQSDDRFDDLSSEPGL